MTKEIITLQVGQCGNQVGFEFWKQLCKEHGINEKGQLEEYANDSNDRKDLFFYQADEEEYVPRSILIDSEPKVIETINNTHKSFFNQENVFISKEGGNFYTLNKDGSANNWGKGYSMGEQSQKEIFDIIDREVENADNLEAFFLIHSISGNL
jgi:tubulin gamma